MTERERLSAFLNDRHWDHRDLAHRLHWSPAFVYGMLGGAWAITDSFRWAFTKMFGLAAAAQVFGLSVEGSATMPAALHAAAPLDHLDMAVSGSYDEPLNIYR